MGANCFTGVQRNEFKTDKYGILYTEFRYCKSNRTTVFRVYNDAKDQELRELNEDIIYILDDIAQDLLIPSSIVKIVYITYVESTQDNVITMRNINFLPKNTVKYIINEFQSRLSEIL